MPQESALVNGPRLPGQGLRGIVHIMRNNSTPLALRYAAAAPKWRDKMRLLGYFDGYLGFLSHLPREVEPVGRVIDIGSGTGAMAEAWVAIKGAPRQLTLVDPSAAMLDGAAAALHPLGVQPDLRVAGLADVRDGSFDAVLAAHVIEHLNDPAEGLADLRRITRTSARLWLVVSKPHWCSVLIWLQWRHRTFQRAEITAMLQDASFSVDSIYAFPAGPPSRTSFGVVARAI